MIEHLSDILYYYLTANNNDFVPTLIGMHGKSENFAPWTDYCPRLPICHSEI